MGSHDEDAAPSQQLVFEQQIGWQSFPGTHAPRGFSVLVLNNFLKIRTHLYLLLAAKDFFRLHSFVPRTALGVQETEKLLQGSRIG